MDTVLVVDDSPMQRQMMTDLLNRNDFAVWTAKDGLDALAQARKTVPDVIVLDIVMPAMNGYEVCRRLKGNPITKDIPVVICSSKTTQVDHYWGLKLGAAAYIDKSAYPQKLVGTLKKLRQPHRAA